MKINWNYIKGVLLITLVVFLYGFANHKNNAEKVHDIIVEFEEGENLFMNYQMVNKLLIQNGETVKNKEKSVIDLHKLEAKIQSHPMVENATVFLTVDGLLKTKIKQRTPIARVVSGNSSYYIDRQGKKMPMSEEHSARVLLVSGMDLEKDVDDVYFLVSTILKDNFLKQEIISIQKMPNKEFVLGTRIGEQEIIVGNIDNLMAKFENLKSFFSKAMVDNSIDNFTSINLKYNQQVVCTKK